MLRAFSNFANNTDFHNPLGKPEHQLLSRKEKIKGRILPLLGQVSLFALSVGMSAMTSGVSDAVLGVAVLSGVVTYLRRSSYTNYKKKILPQNTYDPNIPADIVRFRENYPAHSELPLQLRRLSGEVGLEKAPLIHVGKNTTFAGIIDLNLGKKQDLLIELNSEFLEKQTPELLNHILAHELGHGKFGHTNSLPGVVSGTAVATHISVGIQLGLAGNYLGGIFYAAAAFAGHTAANAKLQQYKERECDRHALLVSGVVPEAVAFFEKETVALGKDEPTGLRLAFGALKTVESMFFAHPSSEKRADYMRSFNRANKGYVEKKRALNGIAPHRPRTDFRMV
ncbi:MAG: M48 family metalloprotease [Alphaproteobacteria bacterium]